MMCSTLVDTTATIVFDNSRESPATELCCPLSTQSTSLPLFPSILLYAAHLSAKDEVRAATVVAIVYHSDLSTVLLCCHCIDEKESFYECGPLGSTHSYYSFTACDGYLSLLVPPPPPRIFLLSL